ARRRFPSGSPRPWRPGMTAPETPPRRAARRCTWTGRPRARRRPRAAGRGPPAPSRRARPRAAARWCSRLDPHDDVSHLRLLSLRDEHLDDGSVGVRLDLVVRLLGLDLDDDVAFRDALAGRDTDADHVDLDRRHPHLRNLDVDHPRTFSA